MLHLHVLHFLYIPALFFFLLQMQSNMCDSCEGGKWEGLEQADVLQPFLLNLNLMRSSILSLSLSVLFTVTSD